ncbi:MAG: hypothetical protein MJ172_06210 [Clostridia bacterium]|nr:hypothetical protein [Clostridia bacterium]
MFLILTVLFLFATNSIADEENQNLIVYLENNEIDSYDEWIDVIKCNYENSRVSSYTNSLRYLSESDEIYFNIEVDYDNELIEVDAIFVTNNSIVPATVLSVQSGSAIHETYSSMGILLYTVSVNATFSYSTNSCSVVSKSGAFERGNSSLWSSTPTVTSGNISTNKAYARISGTATLLWDSSSYQLTLMCDTSGKLSSSFSRP